MDHHLFKRIPMHRLIAPNLGGGLRLDYLPIVNAVVLNMSKYPSKHPIGLPIK